MHFVAEQNSLISLFIIVHAVLASSRMPYLSQHNTPSSNTLEDGVFTLCHSAQPGQPASTAAPHAAGADTASPQPVHAPTLERDLAQHRSPNSVARSRSRSRHSRRQNRAPLFFFASRKLQTRRHSSLCQKITVQHSAPMSHQYV